jgi:hypothetical protein
LNRLGHALAAALLSAVLLPSVAAAESPLADPAEQWLPSTDGATWTYRWFDDTHAKTATLEQYKMEKRTGTAFELSWTTENLGNPDDTAESAGVMGFNRSDSGLINTGWSSTPAPPQFPVLCANATGCGNSLAGSLFMTIWGTRSPVLQEPLVRGTAWSAVGGANNDVTSANRYLDTEQIIVPAFPAGVSAAKVESEITQAGALGDPYGSGVRTVWWVRGVGPVRVLFRHTGGETSQAELVGTSLGARAHPSDVAYLPFNTGDKATYRYSNSKHMRRASTQEFTVAQVVNNTARVDVASKSGPIKAAGSYIMATRLSGVTNIAASTKAATLSPFPELGPRSQPRAKRRRFFTPYDLMTFGYNPVLPAYPVKGQTWRSSKRTRDYKIFGVTGSSRVVGIEKVKTRAGNYNALAVRSRLTQKGFKFGSGVRTSWFAPGKGLVKLTFRHADGSVSTVERVR